MEQEVAFEGWFGHRAMSQGFMWEGEYTWVWEAGLLCLKDLTGYEYGFGEQG